MAGTGVRLFLSGEVAYAADVNTYLMDQVIARFANATARDAAFGDGVPVANGGSGKPQLTEGRFCYLDDIDEVQYYDGSQWQSSSQFTIDDGAITTNKLATGAVINDKVASNAAIALSKLAPGTSGQMIVANGSGVPTYVSISGDIAISNTGVAAIQPNSVALGTDTTGDFVASLVAGTGITLANNSGEGATPTISVTSNTYQPIDSELTAIAGLASAADTLPYFTGSGTASLATFTSVGRSVAGASTVAAAQTALSLGTTDNPSFAGVTADAVQIGITTAGEIDTASGNLTIDSAGGTTTIDDNLIVTGDLTVSGTTTSVNTTQITVNDNIIVLNNDVTGTPTENAGIEIERGTSANVLLRWNETNDKWESTNDGTNYGNIVTTADSGTVSTAMLANGSVTPAKLGAVAPTTASVAYTLASTDAFKIVESTASTAITITVPKDVFSVGATITIVQKGAGQVTLAPFDGSVTLNRAIGLKTRVQYSVLSLYMTSNNNWIVFGDATP